jgi:hypothetical protein
VWAECTIRFQLLRLRMLCIRDIKRKKENPVWCHACIEKIMNSIIWNTKVLLIEKNEFISLCMHAGANALFGWKYHWCFMYGISDDENIEFYFHSYCSYCRPFFSSMPFVVGDVFFCDFDYDWNKTQFSDKQLSSIHKCIYTQNVYMKKWAKRVHNC